MIDQSEILIVKFKDETQLTEVINGHKKLIKNLIKHISTCISPPIQANFFWEHYFMDGNNNLGHKCISNLFSHPFSTNCVGRWFLIINNDKFFKNSFCWSSSFLKGIVNPKKLEIEIIEVLSLFLIGCFVIIGLPKLFSSFSNFFIRTTWSTLTCFLMLFHF